MQLTLHFLGKIGLFFFLFCVCVCGFCFDFKQRVQKRSNSHVTINHLKHFSDDKLKRIDFNNDIEWIEQNVGNVLDVDLAIGAHCQRVYPLETIILNFCTKSKKNTKQVWNAILNCNGCNSKLKQDKNIQIAHFLSCINLDMSFREVSLVMEKLNLSGTHFGEAIDKLNMVNDDDDDDDKDKKANKIATLQEMKKAACNTVEWCVQVINKIGRVMTENRDQETEWKYKVVQQLLPNLSNINGNTNCKVVPDDHDEKGGFNDHDIDKKSRIEIAWEEDAAKLNILSKEEDLDLTKYFESMELIDIQQNRLTKQVYSKVAQINQSLFANEVFVCIVCICVLSCMCYFDDG